MKFDLRDLVDMRDCVTEDIVEREKQIKSGFTKEEYDRPIINNRLTLQSKIQKMINKHYGI